MGPNWGHGGYSCGVHLVKWFRLSRLLLLTVGILRVYTMKTAALGLLHPRVSCLLDENLRIRITYSPSTSTSTFQRLNCIIQPVRVSHRVSPVGGLEDLVSLVRLVQRRRCSLIRIRAPVTTILKQVTTGITKIGHVICATRNFPFRSLLSPRRCTVCFTVRGFYTRFASLVLARDRRSFIATRRGGLYPTSGIHRLGGKISARGFSRRQLDLTTRAELHRRLNLPPSTLIINAVKQLAQRGKFICLMRTVTRLQPQFPRLHLLVVNNRLDASPRPFRTRLVSQIGILKLRSDIVFANFHSSAPRLLNLLSIFYLPACFNRKLPHSVLRTVTVKLPVIAASVHNYHRTIVPSRGKLVIPPGSDSTLTRTLKRLLDSHTLQRQFNRSDHRQIRTVCSRRCMFRHLTV